MKKCIKLKTKKYRLRDSPPYSAMDFPGKTMKGNDGSMYTSKADKNGIYKWVKALLGKATNKTIKKTSSGTNYSSCSTYLNRSTAPFYKYAYKKSVFAPVNVSKMLKCIPPGIVKDEKTKPKHIYEIIDNGGTPFFYKRVKTSIRTLATEFVHSLPKMETLFKNIIRQWEIVLFRILMR